MPLLNQKTSRIWACLGVNPLDMPRSPYWASEGKHTMTYHPTLTSSSVHHSSPPDIRLSKIKQIPGEVPIPYVWGNASSTLAAWRCIGLRWFSGLTHTFSPRFSNLPKTNVADIAQHHWLLMQISRNVNHHICLSYIFCPVNMIVILLQNIVWG